MLLSIGLNTDMIFLLTILLDGRKITLNGQVKVRLLQDLVGFNQGIQQLGTNQ
jgi:hypothetical protein